LNKHPLPAYPRALTFVQSFNLFYSRLTAHPMITYLIVFATLSISVAYGLSSDSPKVNKKEE
jgi:hypothetical protein